MCMTGVYINMHNTSTAYRLVIILTNLNRVAVTMLISVAYGIIHKMRKFIMYFLCS